MRYAHATLLLAIAACGGESDAPDAPSCDRTCGTPAIAGAVAGLPTTELSGLAASRAVPDLLWTIADSGNAPVIYGLGTTGALRGSLELVGATNTDWEDIAVGPCGSGSCVYAADIGDNDAVRAMVNLYEVQEPAAAPAANVPVTFTRYDVRYPDGAHNSEALFIDPRDGASYAITKVTGATASIYALPRTAGTVTTASLVGTVTNPDADPRITGADLFVDDCGARLAIRTYAHLFELRGPSTATIAELLTAPIEMIPVASEPQGESVAFAADGRALFTVSEGPQPNLNRSQCGS